MYKDECPGEDRLPDLEVIGGRGEYAIGGRNHDGEPLRYYADPSQGSQRIDLWESDQGASLEASKVCFDVEVVLRICRHYWETGALDPGVQWVE